MKKIIAMMLALVLVLGVCAGCGDKSKDKVIEPQAVADELKDGIAWDSEMVVFAENDLRYYFDVADDTVIAGYQASTATTEMVVAAQCAAAFDRLPLVQDAGLLKNILYEGVWTRYHEARAKQEQTNEKEGTPA